MTNFATDDDSIMAKFPFATARDGQVDTIRFILNSFNQGKKFVIVEAPCGAGKSAIALATAGFFDKSFYLTIQKVLQDQLINEFGETGKYGNFLVDLKGRSNYECVYYGLKADELRRKKVISLQQYNEYQEYHDCSDGHCRRKNQFSYEECLKDHICPYYNQVEKAQRSNMCLMNFAGFLNQTNYTDRFGPRQLMIIDEGHNIESQLLNFISLTLSNNELPDLSFPKLDTPEEYALWLVEKEVLLLLENKKQKAKFADDPKLVDEIESLQAKLEKFIQLMTEPEHDQWVHEYTRDEKNPSRIKLIFKPVYVKKQALEYLFSYADHILIMSATILNVNVMARSLGIEPSEIAAKRIGSRFPKENRPIYFHPAAKVSGGPSQQHIWGPAITLAVNHICRHHEDHKGIIHTHNFKIAEMLINDCDEEVVQRMLFQKRFPSKAEMLEFHAKSKNTIIVAPAMHEGLDLANDLSRFQIVCKMPFPNFFDDKQLAARKEDDEQFYSWLTALKLVQCVGRSVRSDTDWAFTYIIDESFRWWVKDNFNMLPGWFTEAIINE